MSARIINDGFSNVYLYNAIGASGLASSEFLVTCQMKLFQDLASYETPMVGASTGTFSGGNDYWTAAVFNSPHRLSIGSDGGDTTHASAGPPPPGTWVRMAFQRISSGGSNRDQRWWMWDLDGTNEREVLRADTTGLAYDAAARLCFGAPPYTTNEGIDGWMRCIKVWEIPRTKAEALAESRSGIIETGDGNTSLWGRWPCISDGNDVSGNGRHLSIELNGSSATWLTFDGQPDPSDSGRSPNRIIRPRLFAPGRAR